MTTKIKLIWTDAEGNHEEEYDDIYDAVSDAIYFEENCEVDHTEVLEITDSGTSQDVAILYAYTKRG